MPKIKLLAPISHDNNDFGIGEEIKVTDKQATRLVSLGVAKIIDSSTSTNEDDADPISQLTKKECMAELEQAGINFDAKLKLAELQSMVRELRLKKLTEESSDNEKPDEDPNLMSREQLEAELTLRAIEFDGESDDDELRELVIETRKDDV